MVIDAHNHIGIELSNFTNGNFPYAQSSEDLKIKAQGTGVSHWIVFPFVSYTEGGLPIVANAHIEASAVPYAHANRQLLTEVQAYATPGARDVLPFVIVDPAREPQAQVQSLRRLRETYPIFGIKIQATIIQSRVSALLGEGSCLVDLAAEWDVPMLIHSSIHPDDLWSPCSDILKVAETRPEVRFILAHSCRFHRPSLERVAQLPNAWFDCSAHRIHCQLACDNSPVVAVVGERFDSDYRDPSQVLYDLCTAYPEKLIWGTDSPYYSWIASGGEAAGKLLSSYQLEWDCVAALSAAQQEKITCTNTLNWLNIDENSL